MSDLGFVAILLSQIVLLTLHYGNSTVIGIEWSQLPWFVVWLPLMILAVWSMVLIFVIGAVWNG